MDGKIVYMDGAMASQMSSYAFYKYLEVKGLEPQIDLIWYTRMGWHHYKLKDVFNIEMREFPGSWKYDAYLSKNLFARILRKSGLIKILIKTGVIPSLYYTIKPFWGGNIFSVDDLPAETYDRAREMYFWGYWPMGDYMYEIREELLESFSFPDFEEPANLEIAEEIRRSNSVSIHVRRGDYLDFQDVYAGVSIDFYVNAIKKMNEMIDAPKFFVFSNDIEWCRQVSDTLGLSETNTTYVTWNTGAQSFRDMQLMALCKNNIITNSGFSTWAAFLNRNPGKIVIEPRSYFTKEWIDTNEKAGGSFYKSRWTKIDN